MKSLNTKFGSVKNTSVNGLLIVSALLAIILFTYTIQAALVSEKKQESPGVGHEQLR